MSRLNRILLKIITNNFPHTNNDQSFPQPSKLQFPTKLRAWTPRLENFCTLRQTLEMLHMNFDEFFRRIILYKIGLDALGPLPDLFFELPILAAFRLAKIIISYLRLFIQPLTNSRFHILIRVKLDHLMTNPHNFIQIQSDEISRIQKLHFTVFILNREIAHVLLFPLAHPTDLYKPRHCPIPFHGQFWHIRIFSDISPNSPLLVSNESQIRVIFYTRLSDLVIQA